jgi:hypothetical protein
MPDIYRVRYIELDGKGGGVVRSSYMYSCPSDTVAKNYFWGKVENGVGYALISARRTTIDNSLRGSKPRHLSAEQTKELLDSLAVKRRSPAKKSYSLQTFGRNYFENRLPVAKPVKASKLEEITEPVEEFEEELALVG